MRRYLFRVTAAMLLAAATALIAAASETRSVQKGVFTEEQAERGAAIFEASCAGCHQPEEFGDGAYMEGWSGMKVNDLLELIRATMPQDNPGSLKRQEYVDVIAFLLERSGVPVGESEMDVSSAKEIVIEGPFGGPGGE